MSTNYAGLVSRLESLGVVVDREIRFDGNRVRLRLQGKKNRDVWVYGWTRRGFLYAKFDDWGHHFDPEEWTNRPDGQYSPALDAEELVQVWNILNAKREEDEAKAAKEREAAAEIARNTWAEASQQEAEQHPYILKKGVKPHGLKVLRGELLIPYHDGEGNISTIQRIMADGTKRLQRHGRIRGCCHIIQPDSAHGGTDAPTYICEGWATGASINELTGCKVLVAQTAGNLEAVARTYRQQRAGVRIIIAADNDHETEEKTGKNPGLEYARKAAEAASADLVFPPDDIDGTDFNDMVALGLVAQAAEILTGTKGMISIAEIMRTRYKPIRWIVEGILPEGFTVLAGAPKFGKSWLMLALCFAVANGEQVWGYGKTTRCSVLYLALEDSSRRIQERVEIMDYHEFPENIYLRYEAPNLKDGRFVSWLSGVLDQHPDIGLVIIDTLQKIRPPATGKRNTYQAEYDDFSALQKLGIGRGVAITAVHHTRKRSTKGDPDNPQDEISGSSGIQGVADTIIVCQRKGQDGKMHVTGREVNENTYPMHIDRVDMRWTLSPPEEQALDAGPMLLANWFQEHETITARELAEMEKCNIRTAQRQLKELAEEGKLASEKQGNPSLPVVYRKMEIFA